MKALWNRLGEYWDYATTLTGLPVAFVWGLIWGYGHNEDALGMLLTVATRAGQVILIMLLILLGVIIWCLIQ